MDGEARSLLRQLCDDLRLLRLQAGGPSLRSLAVRLKLSKSQLGSILNGQIGRLPDWEVVRGVVESCRQFADERGRLHHVSLATGIEQFWRPRYDLVDHALQRGVRQQPGTRQQPGVRQQPGRAEPAAGRVPRQLPAAARHFAGRTAPLSTLDGLLPDVAETVVITAVGGTAGVGKTALAVHWAHRVADRFPDGQLYVDLHGFGPAGPPVAPGDVIRRFLDTLGVPAARIPTEPDAQAALYRSELAGRRMLILLDNARDSAQVRPLLPGTPGCLVLITSRDPLTGLVVADGAHPVALDLLTRDEARDLLTRRLGAARIATEPEAVEEIITRCARLPLALAIVAARAVARRIPLRDLADQLRDHRLGPLTMDDPVIDLTAVFASSYRALPPAAARVFRLFGQHPGPDITASAMASCAACPVPEARARLDHLVQANLLTEPVPGRYTSHDLLRAYAADLGDTEPAATARLLDHYLYTASAAYRLLHPNRDAVVLAPLSAGSVPEQLTDHGRASSWFDAEQAVLLAMVDLAGARGYDQHTWQLAWALSGFLEDHHRWPAQISVASAAVAAAGRLADPHASAISHRVLARAYIETGRYEEAHAQLGLALDHATTAGDRPAQAHSHHHLAYLWERQGRHPQALDHTERALILYQEAGHRQGLASALNAVGWYRTQLGDHVGALAACRQALALLQDLGYRPGQAATWDSIGYAHHQLGDHTAAIACFRRAVLLYRRLGDRYHEGSALIHLGDTLHAAGRQSTALAAWRTALSLLANVDHPDTARVRARLADDSPTCRPRAVSPE